MVNDKYLLILVQNGSEWSIIVLSRSNIGVRPFFFLHTVDMRGRFFHLTVRGGSEALRVRKFQKAHPHGR